MAITPLTDGTKRNVAIENLNAHNHTEGLQETITAGGNGVRLGIGDFISSGLDVDSISGLNMTVNSGYARINETTYQLASNSTITLPARSTSLVCLNAGTTPTVTSTLATIPTSYIDNNTVAFWVFNQTTSGAVIPNSAVGISSIAVANDLTPNGGISSVDGWTDYALKPDGSTGYFVSNNYTNIPIGASTRQIDIAFLAVTNSTTQTLCSMGGTTSTYTTVRINPSNNIEIIVNSTLCDTKYTVTTGSFYLISMLYNGTTLYVYVNGMLVYSLAITWASTASNVYIHRASIGTTYFSASTIDYVEIRNAIRTAQQIAQISNKLMLPCFYNKNSAVAPTVPSTFASTYHEYLFSESSGTSVADSNTTSPLNGAATGSTIVDSEIGLTKSRKFAGAGNISVGNFACASVFSYIGVVNIPSYGTAQCLWSNRPSASGAGNMLWVNTSGYLCLYNASTNYVLTSTPITTGTPTFVAVAINGTTAKVYIGSPQSPTVSTITTLNTTSNTAYLGYDAPGNYFTGILEYAMFGNFELTQAEVARYYTALMATGRRSIIDDVLPTNSVALAFARTNSSEIIEYNDADYWTGRREKAVGGNREKFLGWQSFSGAVTLDWESVNPFKGTRNINFDSYWSQDAIGTNKGKTIEFFNNGTTSYGCLQDPSPNTVLRLNVMPGGAGRMYGAYQTSGYIGCYAEVLEDD
ncbi:MAG: Concanavalin A-like lectin/glucanase superfamily [Massilibacillus sp.]|nr:Concanavalin A-like lectin/glucanase superfamily [Massilibacillus sp.]